MINSEAYLTKVKKLGLDPSMLITKSSSKTPLLARMVHQIFVQDYSSMDQESMTLWLNWFKCMASRGVTPHRKMYEMTTTLRLFQSFSKCHKNKIEKNLWAAIIVSAFKFNKLLVNLPISNHIFPNHYMEPNFIFLSCTNRAHKSVSKEISVHKIVSPQHIL